MNDFVNEVNKQVSSFKQQKITEEQLYVNLAITIMILSKYGLVAEFNELSSYYNNNYITTVDVNVVD